MEKMLLTFAMLQQIAACNQDGFTIDKNTLQPVTSGYCVAVKETQNSFGPAGAAKVTAFGRANNIINAFGGWYNSENGQYYYDAVIICRDLETAIKLGVSNKQIAIFDLDNMVEIRL